MYEWPFFLWQDELKDNKGARKGEGRVFGCNLGDGTNAQIVDRESSQIYVNAVYVKICRKLFVFLQPSDYVE